LIGWPKAWPDFCDIGLQPPIGHALGRVFRPTGHRCWTICPCRSRRRRQLGAVPAHAVAKGCTHSKLPRRCRLRGGDGGEQGRDEGQDRAAWTLNLLCEALPQQPPESPCSAAWPSVWGCCEGTPPTLGVPPASACCWHDVVGAGSGGHAPRPLSL